MRFPMQALLMAGLRATCGGLAATTPSRHRPHPRVRPPSGAAGLVVIDGQVAHRIAPTMGRVPQGPDGKGEK